LGYCSQQVLSTGHGEVLDRIVRSGERLQEGRYVGYATSGEDHRQYHLPPFRSILLQPVTQQGRFGLHPTMLV